MSLRAADFITALQAIVGAAHVLTGGKATRPYRTGFRCGSSCIGASVTGGICNNSGGALIRRGPAYTEMALFARVDEHGGLRLINNLGVRLGEDPEEMLRRLERGGFASRDIEHDASRCGSDKGYVHRVREIDADSPARFSADPDRLFDACWIPGLQAARVRPTEALAAS